MDGKQLIVSAKLIMADLSTVTGIALPTGNPNTENTALYQLIGYVAQSLNDDYKLLTVPLVKMAFVKHATVLTTGKEKSYGRILSLVDLQQVLNAFNDELQEALQEEEKINQAEVTNIILSQDDKENIIRKSIQDRFDKNEFDCTYADFNQLMKDGHLTEKALDKNGWEAMQNIKEKYRQLLTAAHTSADSDKESIKYSLQAKEIETKIALLAEIENEIKGIVADKFLQWKKERGEGVYEAIENEG